MVRKPAIMAVASTSQAMRMVSAGMSDPFVVPGRGGPAPHTDATKHDIRGGRPGRVLGDGPEPRTARRADSDPSSIGP